MHLLIISFLLAFEAFAQSALTGIVTDWSNGEPIAGATIEVDLDSVAATDRFGRYATPVFQNESVVVKVSKEGFAPYSALVVLADADQTEFNIELKPYAKGDDGGFGAPKYELEGVNVITSRATSDCPVTYSNLSNETVDRTSYGQDLPQLFTQLPSINTYSDGGNGFGYSYLRLRGFSQNRVGVYLNGIPLNDAESHEVFWIDLPDFAEDVQDIQVQRGIGSSLYGAASLGGSINLVTKTPGVGDKPMLRAETMYGAWNTRRASLQFMSGRVGQKFGFAGRLSRMDSDGYRFGSWVKAWSYYLAATRFSSKHTTRILFYGGPEKTHLAYEGVSGEYLDGEVTGDKEKDRRFNPFTYPGEIDNFFQPHYELHDAWRVRDNLTLDNSFYVFRGDGYYDQFRASQDLAEYFGWGVSPAEYDADVLRRRNISEIDGGWMPRATWKHRYGQTVFGAELRLHKARHEGTAQWLSVVPPGIGPDEHYYDYRVTKQVYAGYVHNLFQISDHLRIMADLQVKSQRYEMKDDKIWNVMLKKSFSAISPRVGVNYELLEGNEKSPLTIAYANLSLAQREPAFRDLYNAQDFYSSPFVAPHRFANGFRGGKYVGPMLDDEKLVNLEIGSIAQWRHAHVGVNYYLMNLTDAIVTDNGQLDDLGNLLSANADQVRHQGIEIVGGLEPVDHLLLSGNLAISDHRFVDYQEVDWTTFELTSRDGNRIGQDPEFLANAQAEFTHDDFRASVGARFVGRQFTDNSENETTAIEGYALLHLDLAYAFRNLPGNVPLAEIRVRVNNLLDTEHETVGYGSSYIVGAPRAIYTTLAIEL